MGALAQKLFTADEFEAIGGDNAGLELIDGRIVERPVVTKRHFIAQRGLEKALGRVLEGVALTATEVPFRTHLANQHWRADVAAYALRRWYEMPDDKVPCGAPDLIVEVLSPSNTIATSNRRRNLCLSNGCREYWIVDLDVRTVEVATDDRTRTVYRRGEHIPLTAFPGYAVSVDEILST